MSRFLASVNLFVESTQIDNVVAALSELENIEEVYEVAGEYDVVTLLALLRWKNLETFCRSKL